MRSKLEGTWLQKKKKRHLEAPELAILGIERKLAHVHRTARLRDQTLLRRFGMKREILGTV